MRRQSSRDQLPLHSGGGVVTAGTGCHPPTCRCSGSHQKASAAARDKETAIRAQDYEKAARLRDAEESFRAQAAAERKKQAREAEKTAVRVTAEDITFDTPLLGLGLTGDIEDELTAALCTEDGGLRYALHDNLTNYQLGTTYKFLPNANVYLNYSASTYNCSVRLK